MKYSVGDGRSSSLFVVVGCLQSPSITTPGTVTLHPEVVFGRSVQASVSPENSIVWLCVQQARKQQANVHSTLSATVPQFPLGDVLQYCAPHKMKKIADVTEGERLERSPLPHKLPQVICNPLWRLISMSLTFLFPNLTFFVIFHIHIFHFLVLFQAFNQFCMLF